MTDPSPPPPPRQPQPSPRTRVSGASGSAAPRAASPLLTGVITSVMLAVAWTLVVYFVHNPLSLAGWGVGGLLGIALAKAAPAPSRELGTLAALLTIGTVILAKALILAVALGPIVIDEVLRNRSATRMLYLIDMKRHRSFSPNLQAALDQQEPEPRDTAGGVLRVQNDLDVTERALAEARARDSQATRAEREQLVEMYADSIFASEGFLPMLGRLFGLWDVVWLVFGVSSAWKLAQSGPG